MATNTIYDFILFTECNGTIGWGRDAGSYTIASYLRKRGYKTLVIDFFSSMTDEKWKKIIDIYVSKSTLAIGFTSTHFSTLLPNQWIDHFSSKSRTRTNNMWNTYFPQPTSQINDWLSYAKQQNKNLNIVVGGQKVAQKRTLAKNYPFVDIWIGGMAELAITNVLKQLRSGLSVKNYVKSELDYGSLSEDEFCSEVIQWEPHDYIFKNESLPLEISRGCPYNCSFCDYQKKKPGSYIKDWGLIKNSLIKNWEEHSINHYMITDFLVNESVEKIEEFVKMVRKLPFEFTWSGFGRLDTLAYKPEAIPLLRESGVKSIQWGIESIRGEVGHLIGKKTDRHLIENLLEKCANEFGNNVIMGSGFIVGLPGETKATAKELFRWLSDQEWLLGWEVTPLFIGGHDLGRSYTIDFSKIQKSPEKFGYKLKSHKTESGYIENWIHGDFSKNLAIDLIEEFQLSPEWKERSTITYHGYSRMLNLDFKHEELLKLNGFSDSYSRKMSDNYQKKASLYFSKLIP